MAVGLILAPSFASAAFRVGIWLLDVPWGSSPLLGTLMTTGFWGHLGTPGAESRRRSCPIALQGAAAGPALVQPRWPALITLIIKSPVSNSSYLVKSEGVRSLSSSRKHQAPSRCGPRQEHFYWRTGRYNCLITISIPSCSNRLDQAEASQRFQFYLSERS